ncbi:MAG: ComF family protein [Saprospiraceae bacterium]|nr:ComF family protein [Saprospiraceae bacterium]
MFTLEVPSLKELCTGLLHLLYPNLCVGCNADLPAELDCFCLGCRRQLQLTNMHTEVENAFTERFWGQLPLVAGAAMYAFQRRSPIQRALHQLKYKNQPDIGVRIGRRFGHALARTQVFQTVQAIVPVPLHPEKERQRGYNQSAMFAQGLAEILAVPVLTNHLVRRSLASSQTRKKRMERFDNVREGFALRRPDQIKGKHLLLVDDVLTTGATLEACGQVLLEVPDVRLSMATIAIAMH